MTDPLGLIGSSSPLRGAASPSGGGEPAAGGPNFKDVLLENISRVGELQQDADRAVEDLHAGRRGDVEGVMIATQKADLAFRALQAVRNRVLQAYEEMQQMRA